MNPEISVIIPIYNSEKYLNRCLASVMNQTFSNIEIILVNDGSQDGSGQICDEMAKIDPRIVIIHKSNGGLSSARNAGIERASGKYIGFVDSDDWISLDMYEYLYSIIHEYNADIAQICDYCTSKEKEVKKQSEKVRLFSGRERLLDYFVEGQFSACVKLYKRELFTGVRFPEGKINEDIVTSYKLLMNSSRIVKSNQMKYFYFLNPNSITNSKITEKDKDLIHACLHLSELAKGDAELEKLAMEKYARSYFSLLLKGYIYGIDASINKNLFEQTCINKLKDHYLLLMKSKIALNRKLFITLSVISPKLLERLSFLILKIRHG